MTSAARPSWRLLAAIVQIAAFLAFAMPGLAHAHGSGHRGGHHQTARADAAPLSHLHAATEDARRTGAEVAALAPDEAAGAPDPAPCCVGCCCHAFVPGPDAAAPPPPTRARAPAPPAEVSFADLTPEALPEPPRSFV